MNLATAFSVVAGAFVERVPVESPPRLQLVEEAGAGPAWSLVPMGEIRPQAERIAAQLARMGLTVEISSIDTAAGDQVALLSDRSVDPAYRSLLATELRVRGARVVEALVSPTTGPNDAGLQLKLSRGGRMRVPGRGDRPALAAARALIGAT
jgi:hypothetical protein